MAATTGNAPQHAEPSVGRGEIPRAFAHPIRARAGARRATRFGPVKAVMRISRDFGPIVRSDGLARRIIMGGNTASSRKELRAHVRER